MKRIGPNLHPSGGVYYGTPIYKANIPTLESHGGILPYQVGSIAKFGKLADAPLLSGPYGGKAYSSASFYKDDSTPVAKPIAAMPIAPLPIAPEPLPIIKSAPMIPAIEAKPFPKSYYSMYAIPITSLNYGGKGAEGLGLEGYKVSALDGLKGYEGPALNSLKGYEGPALNGFKSLPLGGYKGYGALALDGYKGYGGPALEGYKTIGGPILDSYKGYKDLGGPIYDGYKGLNLGYIGAKGPLLGYNLGYGKDYRSEKY